MYGLIISAIYAMLGFIFRSVVVKFALFFGLYFVVTEFIPVMISWVNIDYDLKSLFQVLPDSVWFYIELINFPFGLTIIVNAFLVKFMIRRIPFIG